MADRRDGFLILIVLLLTGLLAAAAISQRADRGSSDHGSIYNNGPDGTSLLMTQLSAWGYALAAAERAPFLVDPGDDTLFVLGVNEDFSRAEAGLVRSWVEAGGTLLVVQDSTASRRLLQQFDMDVGRMWRRVGAAPLRLPALNWPPVGEVSVRAQHQVKIRCGQAAVHLGDCDTPLLVAQRVGWGQVLVLSSLFPLTNEGLRAGLNLQFVANLVASLAPAGGRIRMDEVHRNTDSSLTPWWLVTSPEGLGVLYTLLLLLAYAWWQGRALQSTIPAANRAGVEETVQSTDEFINELANLYQHGRQEKNIQHHYWRRLKRQLARKYRCDYNLDDQAFLTELLPHQEEVDIAALIGLQADLQRPELTESHLVWWVTQIIEQTDRLRSN